MGTLRKLLGRFTGKLDAPLKQAEQQRPIHSAAVSKTGAGIRNQNMGELLYPIALPTFEDLADDGHTDMRAVVYTLLHLDTKRKRPFSWEEISAYDFGKRSSAYSALLEKGLIEKLKPDEELVEIFTKDELASALRTQGLRTSGNKQALAERLVSSGYKIDRRKHRGRLFKLTEYGMGMISQYRADEEEAIRLAIDALKGLDYKGAISAYRRFDNKWGFAHTSGKNHTIFAHYDIPRERFLFLEGYRMCELYNSENFKNTLRACLIAGLMRGCQGRWELRTNFESVCEEKIVCPGIVGLFGLNSFDPEERSIRQAMEENVRSDIRYTLEYYISHVMYLCRQRG